MNFKSNVDYQNLSLQYIRNEKLVEEIQNNIQFVEKYYYDVDVRYKDIKEQQIVYKQLGIIAFSCVEALWKGIVMAVNDICSSRNCNIKKCKYRKFNTLKKINMASDDKILAHLTNMRLLYVHSYEIEAIEELQHLRNHVHLTRTLTDDVDPKVFDKIFVEDMLAIIVNFMSSSNYAANVSLILEFGLDELTIGLYTLSIKFIILFSISSLLLLILVIFFIRALVLECLPALREKIVEKLRERIEAKKQQKLVKAEQDKAKRIERLEKELDELKKDK